MPLKYPGQAHYLLGIAACTISGALHMQSDKTFGSGAEASAKHYPPPLKDITLALGVPTPLIF